MSDTTDGTQDLPRATTPSPSETNGADKDLYNLLDELERTHELAPDNLDYFGRQQWIKDKKVASLLQYMDRAETENIKRGFYAGQAMARVELDDCHANWKRWNNPKAKESEDISNG